MVNSSTLLTIFKQYTIEEINQTLPIFGINIEDDATTDPMIMKQILDEIGVDIENLKKNDPSGFLNQLVTEKIPLRPLKERILLGITNHPLGQTLVEVAQNMQSQKKSVPTLKANQTQLKYAIYFAVILQVFTHLMVNDKNLENNIVNAILKNRHSVNPGSTFWNFFKKLIETKGNLFVALKQISIDPAMFTSMCWRKYPPQPTAEQINEFIKENNLTGLNASILKKTLKNQIKKVKHYGMLCGNILEALITEENSTNKKSFLEKIFNIKSPKKSIDNVKAGLALILYQEMFENSYSPHGFEQGKVVPDDKFQDKKPLSGSTFWDQLYNYTTEKNLVMRIKNMPKEWVNLYESWNIAFNLHLFPDRFHLLLPPLLIPETLSSNPETYLATRTTSLWLTINFMGFMRTHHVKVEYQPPNMKTLLQIFGKNNVAYAQNLLLKFDVDLEGLYKKHLQDAYLIYLYVKVVTVINGNFVFPQKEIEKLKQPRDDGFI